MAKLKIINPATGAKLAEIAADDATSVRKKFLAARAAQPGWAVLPLGKRIQTLRKFRAALVAATPRLARILTREVGKPIRQSENELKGVLGRIDFFLDCAVRVLGTEKVAKSRNDDDSTMTEEISHAPLGVIANISAWNYPYFVGSNVFVPALLAGNAVLYKPSEYASLTGREIARLLHRAGVPRNIFVPLLGGGAVGSAILDQPLDGVFFTGSYATGRRIAETVAGRMIKLQLELGGKDPAYVAADADVDAAAVSLADGAFYNSGQSCCSVERIYVHRSVHDRFVQAFLREVEGFKIGDPLKPETYLGPLAREPQLAVLEAQVKDATRRGAVLLCGGKRLDRPGYYFAPTVLVGVNHEMALMREESFGPVIGIMSVRDDAEATRLMNDTAYGLTAGVYSRSEKRARTILGQLRAGSHYWNCCDRVSPRLPWSGVGHSGIGLTLSTYGLQTFTRPIGWHLRSPKR